MGTKQTTAQFLDIVDSDEGLAVMAMKQHMVGGAGDSLFGGIGLAAGLITLEHLTGRPAVYMTCQFVSTIAPPAELKIATEVLAAGRSVSQGRVTASCDGDPIVTMLGACGSRREDHRSAWHSMPAVADPDDCEPLQRFSEIESLHDHVDVRMARGMFGFAPEGAPGRGKPSGDQSTLIWMRMPNVRHDAAALAIMADYLPSAIGNSLGERTFCSSLDNTIRFDGPIASDATSEWVLGESHVEFVGNGFAATHGSLWSRDGRLLATANQSTTASVPRD